MSLRHGLLGLLAEGPASGYDLTRRFHELLGSVWPAQHPQIYSELSRLDAAGLIEVDSRGPRQRKAYRITDAGLTEVRRWLTDDDVDHTVRLESLLRSVFFWLMEPGELAVHLERERRFYADTADGLRRLASAKDCGEFGASPQGRSLRMAAEAAIRVYDALACWAEWAAEHGGAGRIARPPESAAGAGPW